MSAIRIDVPVDSFHVRSHDGLRVLAHRVGNGPHHWLLTPGMGTPLLCWKHIFERFGHHMTMVTWDERGTYGSESPRTRAGLSFEDHLRDGLAVLDALGWGGRFVTGSWSMGVQLGLEIHRRMPQRIAGLVLINGAFEHVLRPALGPALPRPLLRALLRASIAAAPLSGPFVRRALRHGVAGWLMHALGVSTANRELVTAVTRALSGAELGNYLRILLELDRHSARAALAGVEVPTLIMAGTDDVLAPPAVARELRRLLPHASFVEVSGGTHYTPLEYPELLNRVLERFFREDVFPQSWGPAT